MTEVHVRGAHASVRGDGFADEVAVEDTSSSCGVCGKGALEEVAVAAPVARGGRVNVYTRPERIGPRSGSSP